MATSTPSPRRSTRPPRSASELGLLVLIRHNLAVEVLVDGEWVLGRLSSGHRGLHGEWRANAAYTLHVRISDLLARPAVANRPEMMPFTWTRLWAWTASGGYEGGSRPPFLLGYSSGRRKAPRALARSEAVVDPGRGRRA